jgi:hypothetical protein
VVVTLPRLRATGEAVGEAGGGGAIRQRKSRHGKEEDGWAARRRTDE